MRRSRIGLLGCTAVLLVAGGLPPVAAMAQPTPSPAGPTTEQPAPEPTSTEAPEPTSTEGPQPSHDHDMLKGVLHGEGLVQTTKGPIRVAVQRGETTKLTPTSVTVRSSDGFTRSWNLDANVRVSDKRHSPQPGGLRSGAQVTVAGTAPASASGSPSNAPFTAKWVVIQSAGSPTAESS